MDQTGQAQAEVTEWVEVKAEGQEGGQEGNGENQQCADSNLYIEYGWLRLTASSGYPIESLIILLREMCAA